MTEDLRIEVLGPVRAWRGAVELTLGPARQRAVFAVLALRAGRPVTRAELESAVWGADAPKSVTGNIHTYVSGLRRVLEPDRDRWDSGTLLTSDTAGYRLRAADLDAAAFERLVARGGDADGGAVEALDSALALWRGEPLSGLPGPFAAAERSRLVEVRLTALERRASALLALGAHQELVAELTALVGEYPLRERLRELLMLALHRGGQRAEALEVFAAGRRVLAEELGVEPGNALRELHARLLDEDVEEPRLLARPAPAGARFVGRLAEVRRLRTLVDAVCEGRGGAVWLEGDFGIGKSALLAQALADVPCQLGWAVADERSARVPLRVMHECLGLTARLPDGRDCATATADVLLARVTELCAAAPLVLVVDGMQWADEASVQLWHRLAVAARALPLLLVAAARPVPRTPALVRLRHELHSRDDVLLLGPLSSAETLALQELLTGAPAGPQLRDLVLGTTGNPLYVTELTSALRREAVLVTADGVDDLARTDYPPPQSLVDTVRRHLLTLSPEAGEVLRAAALLGVDFTVTDVAAVAGKRPSDLLATLEEATAANVLVDAGPHLAFRHPLLRQACYDEIPTGARDRLHRSAAEALTRAGAPVTRVADQLAATPETDAWVLAWLVDNHEALAHRAPLVAAELLARAVTVCPSADPRREVLASARVRVLYRLDRQPEQEAADALAMTTDPFRAAEMRQLLAAMRFRGGDVGAAIRTVAAATDDESVPEIWRRRHRHLLAGFRRGRLDDLDAAEAAGYEALEDAAGDEYLTAHARQTLWLVASVRRDHEAALSHVDAALARVRAAGALTDVELDLLDNRLFTCHNLDRLDEAEATLRVAGRAAFQIPSAVHHYWLGRWNEALVELDEVPEDGLTFLGLRDPSAMAVLWHGVAALVAGRRGDTIEAAAHLDAVARQGSTDEERENIDFLLAAQAVAAQQQGSVERALALLDPLLSPDFAPMMLRHQWLPGIVRLAQSVGDDDRVARAMDVCGFEARRERVTARATVAAWWCQGLVAGDPSPVLTAAAHYRRIGRRVEFGEVLEDAAVLLARRGDLPGARAAFAECVEVYGDLSARWDIERAEARLAEFAIRRTPVIASGQSRPARMA
ncbi:BTAD domain-containing putative transcriptional regulator [Actinophytocola oryzae]|uniref:DNA-binding SARP family transcriptional activator n=1 Tax=Actinophytocola oryzae TaxID=502181 RepID=A0A4V6Q6V2_9PSEU|nr:BTAD domain-containing putative transcriptional regulator [Actinophytocola oryzae]TDV52041.1 DNA-binding SARP family transcriptional activator [Actinophytocola oryzae]